MKRIYEKPPLTTDKLVSLLISRGLEGEFDEIKAILLQINYYRLTGYTYFCRVKDSEEYRPGTSIRYLWDCYRLDRQLRLIIFDAVERIEIQMRNQLIRLLSRYGADSYRHIVHFPNIKDPKDKEKKLTVKEIFQKQLDTIDGEIERSKERFAKHHRDTYENNFPVWKALELVSFGTLSRLYSALGKDDQQFISSSYDLSYGVAKNWLHVISYMRNHCAHHSRLWNHRLAIKLSFPRDRKLDGHWKAPYQFVQYNDSIFSFLTILCYLLHYIAPKTKWKERLVDILSKFEHVSLKSYGFPDNWKDFPIWGINQPFPEIKLKTT